MKKQIVISRYNEDISWVKKISREDIEIFIYNKGEKIEEEFTEDIKVLNLENIGRESHTYLHHIINNYGNFPEKIIFTQGHPDDHVPQDFKNNFLSFFNSNLEFEYFSKDILEMKILEDGVEESGNLNGSFWRNKHSPSSCCVTIPSEIIPDIQSKKWIFGTGAIFGVSKNLINKNSKEFYIRCLEILGKSSNVSNPPEGHAFERSWYLIFNQ